MEATTPARIEDSEAIRVRLKRMFPRCAVFAEAVDYSHSATFTIADQHRVLGINTHLAFADPQGDARRIGGEFLRAAYPRGWAQP